MSNQKLDNLIISSGLTMPKTSGTGIKVDNTAPTFPWRDLTGVLSPDPSGVNAPLVTAFRTPVRAWFFNAASVMDCSFHMPHDYVPGTDLYLHVHWSHDNTSISGNVSFVLSSSYARRSTSITNYFFNTAKTHTITYNTVNITTTPRYVHHLDEIAISGAADSGTLYNRTILEVDGVLLLRVTCPTLPTMSGGTARIPIMHIDLHYQSTNVGTKDKAEPFYG